jgi:hypothetical protein
MAMATRIGSVSPNPVGRFAAEAADQLAGQRGSRDDSSDHHATAPAIVAATSPVEATGGRSQRQRSTPSRY